MNRKAYKLEVITRLCTFEAPTRNDFRVRPKAIFESFTSAQYTTLNAQVQFGQSSCVLGNTIHRFLGNQTHVDYFKLLRKDGNSLLIGARNMIFNLSLPTLEENVLEVSQFITFMHSQLASFPFGLVNYESARYESLSVLRFGMEVH